MAKINEDIEAAAVEEGVDDDLVADDEEVLANLDYLLANVRKQAPECPCAGHVFERLQYWQEHQIPPEQHVSIPHPPPDPNAPSSSTAPPAVDPMLARCNAQCCRMAAVLTPENPTFR